MIASDYLRCAPSDVEARRRREAIVDNLISIICDTAPEDDRELSYEEIQILAGRVLDHMMLSCYFPADIRKEL